MPQPQSAINRVALSITVGLCLSWAVPHATAALPAALAETHTLSLAPMIKRVSPAVVNIATRGTVSETGPQNPLSEDPFFRRFFNTPPDLGPKDHAFQSAGSGVIFNAQSGYILSLIHIDVYKRQPEYRDRGTHGNAALGFTEGAPVDGDLQIHTRVIQITDLHHAVARCKTRIRCYTWVRRANVFAPPVIVHLVDAVDENEARLGEVIRGCHDEIPHTPRRKRLIDFARNQSFVVDHVVLVNLPLSPQELAGVRQIELFRIVFLKRCLLYTSRCV